MYLKYQYSWQALITRTHTRVFPQLQLWTGDLTESPLIVPRRPPPISLHDHARCHISSLGQIIPFGIQHCYLYEAIWSNPASRQVLPLRLCSLIYRGHFKYALLFTSASLRCLRNNWCKRPHSYTCVPSLAVTLTAHFTHQSSYAWGAWMDQLCLFV